MAAFLLMPWLAVAQEPVEAVAVSATVQQAMELLHQEKYREAAGICQDAKELTGKDSELCLLAVAVSFNRLGNHKEAIEASRELTETAQDPRGLALAFRELGTGLVGRLKDKAGAWPVGEPSGKFLDRLHEAEQAFRKSLDVLPDDDGSVHLALVDVVATDMLSRGEWDRDDELKELARFFLARHPSGPRADWAREAACLSDRYLGSGEAPAPSPPDTAEEDAIPDLSGGGEKDVIPPQNISAPQPKYTRLARRARVQGVVMVQAVIDRNGNVRVDRVVKGLPGCLTEEAVLAIETWKFEPARLDGKPVDVYYNLAVKFRL